MEPKLQSRLLQSVIPKTLIRLDLSPFWSQKSWCAPVNCLPVYCERNFWQSKGLIHFDLEINLIRLGDTTKLLAPLHFVSKNAAKE